MNEYKKSDTNEQREYPKIIKVKKSDIKNDIEMDVSKFFDLINNDRIDVIFRDNYRFFIVKEGCRFSINHFGFFGFEEYFKATKLGFKKKDEYDNAIELGIDKYENYISIYNKSKSYFDYHPYHDEEFYRDVVKHCKEYIKVSKLGFQKKDEYDNAIKLGIDNYEDYSSFKKSGFYKFEEYLKVKKLGFKNKGAYDDARGEGFNNSTEYKEFLESGCKSKEEFKFFKKIPQIIKIMNKKLNEIVKDADNAFKSNRFEEYIRLKFLSIEKMADIMFLNVFKQERKGDIDLIADEIINQIEIKLKKELTDHEELKYWRRIRNDIIHKHLKIERDKAEKGKEFFDELYNNLKKYS